MLFARLQAVGPVAAATVAATAASHHTPHRTAPHITAPRRATPHCRSPAPHLTAAHRRLPGTTALHRAALPCPAPRAASRRAAPRPQVTLLLNWNTVPSTGLLALNHGFSSKFEFVVPSKYS